MTTQESPSIDQVRILVVDDHPNTANTLARSLAQLGPRVDVISAVSGREALEKVKSSGVDILITDMIMPEMTGLELIEKMQNHPGGRPAFTYLVTAYDVPGLKVTAHRLKVNEVIVKPVRPERICQIATQAMEEMKHLSRPLKKVVDRKKKFKILVADDRPDNITLLTRYLEYEGYENVIARDGVEALDKVHDELPDLVLLDINMPNKDGFTVLEEIRSDPAIEHIPVIILTAARLDPADIQSGLNLGADDYVTKPFDRHELMARIRTKLRVKEAEDVIRRRNRELSLLPEIGKELSARLDIKDLASVLLKRTVETLGANQGGMIMLDAREKVEQSFQFKLSPVSFSTNQTIISENSLDAIKEQARGFIIQDTQADPDWQEASDELIRSVVVAPLFGRHQLLGVLALTNEQDHYFNLEHLLLLQAIASQAAIAIENARLYSNVEHEQQRLAAVLRNAADAILMFDAEGRLSLLNPAAERLFTDFSARLNQPMEYGFGYDEFIQMIEKARSSQAANSGEVTWPDKRVFATHLTPIESGGVIALLYDVTRFKDVDKVKDEFIATASHDLKNPITAILGFSQLITQAGPFNEAQLNFVHRIQSAAGTMNELVQNMMQLAQVDLNTSHLHLPVEMGALLSEIADEFLPQAQAKDQTLNFIPLRESVPVKGDPLQLRQVFRNLVGNAIKYTPADGTITLSPKVKNGKLVVQVQDTGYGIPASDLPFIFDRFYRVSDGRNAQEEGHGLGLAIVKSIVEQHSGQVSVQSQQEKGTTFNIELPAITAERLSAIELASE
jgi:signal transduction histidine kinase/DNA-binding response OmpR family regulator